MDTIDNLHAGHRERLKQKFLKDPSVLTDCEILEMILYRSLPRINTNPLAHILLRTFGSLQGVFSASASDLLKINGVGEKTAIELSLYGQIIARAKENKKKRKALSNQTEKNIAYAREFFLEQETEGFLVCMVDETLRIISELYYNSGMVHSVRGDLDELVGALAINKPKFVFIAHSHSSGNENPSKTDDRSTARIHLMCSAHGATLIDHVIIAGNKSFSYSREGRLQSIKETCKFENMEF
jgi:DNA repair protein RadC